MLIVFIFSIRGKEKMMVSRLILMKILPNAYQQIKLIIVIVYYLNGSQRLISDIDLDPAVGAQYIVNIIIVCKIDTRNGSYWC